MNVIDYTFANNKITRACFSIHTESLKDNFYGMLNYNFTAILYAKSIAIVKYNPVLSPVEVHCHGQA